MARVLFATWDGGGNLPPAAATAVQLAKRGHQVHVIGHASQRTAVEAYGLVFEPYREAAAWPVRAPGAVLRVVFDRALGAEVVTYAQHSTSAQRCTADLVLVDSMLVGATDAVCRAGLAWAVLHHTFYMRGPRVLPVLARARGMVMDWDRAATVVTPTLRELDSRSHRPPPNVVFTGPVWQDHPPSPAEPDGTEPLILVSLSTNGFPGQQQTLQKILDAVTGLPVRAFVTTGPAVEGSALHPPPNAELHRYVPHGEVLPRASLVIGHGGHCTTMRALAHDLPLIIIPSLNTTDQPTIGKTLQAHGAAIALRRSTDIAAIRGAVEHALDTASIRRAAAELGTTIRDHDGAVTAADHLETLLTPAR